MNLTNPTERLRSAATRCTRVRRVLALFVFAIAASSFAAGAGSRVKVALAARAMIDAPQVRLGAVAVIDAADPALTAELDAVIVGFAPAPDETRALDRRQIVEALALAGYPQWEIDFDGASRVELTRTSQFVPTQKIRRALEAALAAALEVDASELMLSELALDDAPRVGGGPMELEAQFLNEPRFDTPLHSRILVIVSGVPAAEVDASLTVTRRRSASSRSSLGPEASDRRRARRERLVRAGQPVMIELQGPGLRITASGRARASGALGDEIPVENSASGVVVVGVVESEGRVSVRFNHSAPASETGQR